MSKIALAVDIGGSKRMVGFVNEAGTVLASEKRGWNPQTGDDVMNDVILAAQRLRQAQPELAPEAVGVTIPGLADPDRGAWVEASFSGIRDLPVRQILGQALGLPVYLDNDTRACACAEHRWGCCRGTDDFVWITISNGIGGAVYANGRPYRGGFGNAGEVGHIVLVEGEQARPCKCGHRGCAEAYASGRGLRQNYLELGGAETVNGAPADGKSIDALARQGDPVALEAYRVEGEYLGRVVGMCANLLNPRKVVLGGGVAMAFDLFRDPLMRAVREHVYAGANPALAVEATALGYNAALLGAAALAFQGIADKEGGKEIHA